MNFGRKKNTREAYRDSITAKILEVEAVNEGQQEERAESERRYSELKREEGQALMTGDVDMLVQIREELPRVKARMDIASSRQPAVIDKAAMLNDWNMYREAYAQDFDVLMDALISARSQLYDAFMAVLTVQNEALTVKKMVESSGVTVGFLRPSISRDDKRDSKTAYKSMLKVGLSGIQVPELAFFEAVGMLDDKTGKDARNITQMAEFMKPAPDWDE